MLQTSNSALIGHTGFVGSTLLRERAFSDTYNSQNIAAIAGREFDAVICAGAPANMWMANQNPANDEANLLAISSILSSVKAKRFILISTIAVFDDLAAGYDEFHARYEIGQAYGRNRRAFEEKLQEHFPNIHILRLPALFGKGLKKNFIFDILNPVPSFLNKERFSQLKSKVGQSLSNSLDKLYAFDSTLGMMALNRPMLDGYAEKANLEQAIVMAGLESSRFTNSQSWFQYYDLSRLADDIDLVISKELEVVNICSEPIAASDIHIELTGEKFENSAPKIVMEDIHSIHAESFNNNGPYLFDRADTLRRLKQFHAAESNK